FTHQRREHRRRAARFGLRARQDPVRPDHRPGRGDGQRHGRALRAVTRHGHLSGVGDPGRDPHWSYWIPCVFSLVVLPVRLGYGWPRLAVSLWVLMPGVVAGLHLRVRQKGVKITEVSWRISHLEE